MITVTDQTDTNELRDNCSTLDADDGPQNQSDETKLVTDMSTDMPVETVDVDRLYGVTTRSAAAAAASCCVLDSVSDQCNMDVTTSATVDEDSLQETLRQFSDIDMTDINGSDECQPISAGAVQFREAHVNELTLSAWT